MVMAISTDGCWTGKAFSCGTGQFCVNHAFLCTHFRCKSCFPPLPIWTPTPTSSTPLQFPCIPLHPLKIPKLARLAIHPCLKRHPFFFQILPTHSPGCPEFCTSMTWVHQAERPGWCVRLPGSTSRSNGLISRKGHKMNPGLSRYGCVYVTKSLRNSHVAIQTSWFW